MPEAGRFGRRSAAALGLDRRVRAAVRCPDGDCLRVWGSLEKPAALEPLAALLLANLRLPTLPSLPEAGEGDPPPPNFRKTTSDRFSNTLNGLHECLSSPALQGRCRAERDGGGTRPAPSASLRFACSAPPLQAGEERCRSGLPAEGAAARKVERRGAERQCQCPEVGGAYGRVSGFPPRRRSLCPDGQGAVGAVAGRAATATETHLL